MPIPDSWTKKNFPFSPVLNVDNIYILSPKMYVFTSITRGVIMKKILPFLMVLMVLFPFVACDNGNGGSSGGNPADYVGTWTVTMGSNQMSITLNADGSCVAYNSEEGFAEANWNVTDSGVTITISGVGSLSGKLENGKLVVNYMGVLTFL